MKITQRNRRVIKVLKMQINTLKKLVELTDDVNKKDSYMEEAIALSSCIRLLVSDDYLKQVEKYYFIK